jgi:radical SAM protein with 4Fe4S-binding SPASM domain
VTVVTRSYTEFSRRLHDGLGRRRVPIDVSIEVTRRCPLACAHCYNNLPMSDLPARRRELSKDEHVRILDELADAGTVWLLYTGGEIFARADFLDIYRHAKGRGFIVTLFTNATLVTPRVADVLADWRPFSVEVTLYGRTRETYERLTGVPGSYDRCLAGIRLLIERGLAVSLKTVAVSLNRHEIWDMKRFAAEELGVEFKFDAMMTPRLDCGRSPLAVRLRPEEIVELDLLDTDRVREWAEQAAMFIRPQHLPGHESDVYHCGGGNNGLSIDPYGGMSLCNFSMRDVYDLRTGSIAAGWDFLHGVRRRQITRVTKCTACQLKSLCSMCPAMAELEGGDPETPVDFLCEVAHLRAATLGWSVPEHGTCEYCPGGERHAAVLGAAARLEARVRDARSGAAPLRTPRVALPVLASPAEGGCSSGCGSCGGRGEAG